MKRTNIMLTEKQHKTLKSYAEDQGRTLGDLIREAVDAVYEKKDILERRRLVALSAYKEGFISLGKLAEILGLDPASARIYLKEKGIPVKTQEPGEVVADSANA